MIGESPKVSTGRFRPGRGWTTRGLTVMPLSAWSAARLVAVAFALTVLAGALTSTIRSAGWGPIVRALCVGGVLLGVYAAVLGVVWATSATRGVRFAEAVGLGRATALRWYGIAVGAAVGGWVFSAAFTTLLTALGFDLPREDLALFGLMPNGPLGVAIMALVLIVVAPFAEEVVYRGVLLPALGAKWGAGAALAVSTVVFSAVHVSVVGFVPLLVVGALFGWLFIASRSLGVAVLAHAVFNALGVAVLLTSKTAGLL